MRNQLLTFSIALLLASCANVRSPTGGPKDEDPPKLVSSTPQDQQTNFHGKEIVLSFNEYVKPDNIKENLIIAPRVSIPYEYKVKKQSIYLEFDKPLPDSTTYSFNFGEGIKDITEGNPWKESIIAFSTGPIIDTASISGNVKEILANAPAKDYTVALYRQVDTANIFNHSPAYFTKTDKSGHYKIQNLRPGRYQIFAFDDKNHNLMADPSGEKYGFYPDTLQLDTTLQEIDFVALHRNVDTLQLRSARTKAKHYELKFNKPLAAYHLETKDSLPSNLLEDNLTIRIYNTIGLLPNDSIRAIINAFDSVHQQIKDTLYIKFSDSKVANENFAYKTSPDSRSPITNQTDTFTITTNKPLVQINADSLWIYQDSLHQFALNDIKLTVSDHQTKVGFILPLKQIQDTLKKWEKDTTVIKKVDPSRFTLQYRKGFLISVEQDTSVQTSINYTIGESTDFGVIKGKVVGDKPFFIELMDKDHNVIRSFHNTSPYTFSQLNPGEYYIRVKVDQNENGQWDNGDIYKRIPPEPVYYLDEKLTIRANWELIDKNISFGNAVDKSE